MSRTSDIHSLRHVQPSAKTDIHQESRPQPLMVVSDTGDLVLFAGQVYQAKRLKEGQAQERGDLASERLWLIPRSVAEETQLSALASTSNLSQRPVSFAHGNQAFTAHVQSAKVLSQDGVSVWEVDLTFPRKRPDYGNEFSLNGVSSHEFAQMRAELILLDHKPAYGEDLIEGLMAWIVGGIVGPNLQEGIFPLVWSQFHGHQDLLAIARLSAVYYLLETHTCHDVLDLSLGPIEGGALKVHLRALRHRTSVNLEPVTIAVDGLCPLKITVSDSATNTTSIP